MPLQYLRRLTSADRTESANRHLARYLAFIAGAVNVGGFLALHQHTSHMSGVVSSAADNLAAGRFHVVLDGLGAVLAFFSGACVSTVLIRWGKSRELVSRYAIPLLSEAALLVFFGVVGKHFAGNRVESTIALLCFTMGLQNAMITKISDSVIRTTHVTGMITDIGIAMGRIVFGASRADSRVGEEIATLGLLTSLVFLFFFGGAVGAIGFHRVGFSFTLPLALALVILAVMPVIDDLRARGVLVR